MFKDRHVVAVAAKSGAQVITTSNLKDFVPLPSGIEAQSPDELLCNLFDLDPRGFVEMLQEQAGDLVNPPMTIDGLLERLGRVVPDLVDVEEPRLIVGIDVLVPCVRSDCAFAQRSCRFRDVETAPTLWV